MAYTSIRREDIDPYQKPDWLEFESVPDSDTLVRPKVGFAWDDYPTSGLTDELLSVLATVRPTVVISNNATDANNDIDFSAGVAWDKVNLRPMTLTAMTKRLDASFAAGDAAGGLFSGTKAANTWYYCFVIRKISDGTIDCGFDTSKTAANIPAGYSGYRRVGAVLTDPMGNILAFFWQGHDVRYKTNILDVNVTTHVTSAVSRAMTAPPNMVAYGGIHLSSSNTTFILIYSKSGADYAPPAQDTTVRSTNSGTQNSSTWRILLDDSSTLNTRRGESDITASLYVTTYGFIDDLED